MNVNDIKNILKRKAVIFHTGGIRPTKELLESWIGSVCWKQAQEELPLDNDGKKMQPLATFFLKGLPFCPNALEGIELVTVFMSEAVLNHLITEDLSQWFVIRTYRSLEDLVPCEYISNTIKPFPLVPELVENDYPTWDNGGIPMEIGNVINEMEETEGIEYFDDICEENYAQHKVGGYPAFCQGGQWFGEDYPFVLQISSDSKACLNIVDSGSFYFYYNSTTEDWKVYCDFY